MRKHVKYISTKIFVAFYENLSKSFKSDMINKSENVSLVFFLKIFVDICQRFMNNFLILTYIKMRKFVICTFPQIFIGFYQTLSTFFPSNIRNK